MDHFSVDQNANTDLSFINLYTTTQLIKSRFPNSFNKQCIKAAKKGELSSEGTDVKNLTGARKGTWLLHQEEYFTKQWKTIDSKIFNMIRSKVNFDDAFTLWHRDSWYAEYTDDSIVAPHDHGNFLGRYSFCYYLETADEGTVLYFYDNGEQHPHRFFAGDIVIFPSGLTHWSNDTCENRKIISGNFLVTVEPLQVMQQRQENI